MWTEGETWVISVDLVDLTSVVEMNKGVSES